MPKLTLMLDRKTIQVYDLDKPTIRIGRTPGLDIVIDNVSVSRQQAEICQVAEGWIVRDSGSSNGTFVNGQRVTGDRSLQPGDEIAVGKYSLFFEHALSGATPSRAAAARPAATARPDATMYLKPEELEQLQKSVAQKRQAHLVWEAGGRRGTHYLTADVASVLIGTSPQCDLRVPQGPRQHVLVARGPEGFEVRNLSSWLAFWRSLRVNGKTTAHARLASGDMIEIGGLKLTFMDEVR